MAQTVDLKLSVEQVQRIKQTRDQIALSKRSTKSFDLKIRQDSSVPPWKQDLNATIQIWKATPISSTPGRHVKKRSNTEVTLKAPFEKIQETFLELKRSIEVRKNEEFFQIIGEQHLENYLVHYKDQDGNTLLHYAAKENQNKIVLFLLTQGALQTENLLGKTPYDIVKTQCESDPSFLDLKKLFQAWKD